MLDTAASIHPNPLRSLLLRWKEDPNSTFRTWFLWEDRIKNFRSIRRGLEVVVAEIEAGTFGNTYKGSSLETVVGSIAEQRQIFKGADHAFLWKPKLRIPDIYEAPENQRAFGRFLQACGCCDNETQVLQAIRQLDAHKIKGLGPAAANLLYFLHPTIAPPFNTAMVKGFNVLTGSRVKLGHWDQYLAMRRGVLELNEAHRDLLSNDLGAIAGFLFDVGSGALPAPPPSPDGAALAIWREELEKLRDQDVSPSKAALANFAHEHTHTEIQGWLRDLGLALGFAVWIAANDRARPYSGGRLSDGCLDRLPPPLADSAAADSIRLIDVLWIDTGSGVAQAAFEVEHTTSIYSGIVRMLDLALGLPGRTAGAFFLVAPDEREGDVRAQIARPAFSRVADLEVGYLPYSALRENRDAIGRFGSGLKGLRAIARPLR